MQTTLESVLVPRKVWSREETHQLAKYGFLNANKLELINGDLIDRMGKKQPHVLWQTLIHAWLAKTFGPERVLSESPIDVSEEDNSKSEPEPDLVVTRNSVREYTSNPAPKEILLLIEISDSTLQLDLKIKAALYARAEIIEYWVIDVAGSRTVVHRSPFLGSFADIAIYGRQEEISPLMAPDARFCLDRI